MSLYRYCNFCQKSYLGCTDCNGLKESGCDHIVSCQCVPVELVSEIRVVKEAPKTKSKKKTVEDIVMEELKPTENIDIDTSWMNEDDKP